MVHTKESFEAYLEACRADNKYGDRPPVETTACPICPGLEGTLRFAPLEHSVGEYTYTGTSWYYMCDNCGESWTTSESDGVSLASLKLKS